MGLLDRFRNRGPDRVAVLGVAGLPFSLVSNEELMPRLASLAEAADGNAIESVLPPEESACWPALMSGCNPGRTGIYGLLDREVGTYDTYVPQGADVQTERIWDHAERAGRSATVLNVPVTNPPQKEVGRMAAGPQAPDVDRAAQPSELRRYLSESDYRLDVDAALGQEGDREALVSDARETLEARFEAFGRYVDSEDWGLFVGCVTAPDRLNHFVWDDLVDGDQPGEAVRSFYETLDEGIAGFRDALPEDVTFLLVGDHGFASLRYEVDCQRWLEREGWLSWADDPETLGDIADDTSAFALPHGRFYLNREGREPRGAVPVEEVEAELTALADALEGLTSPDGRSVIKGTYRVADLYDGPHTDLAPDLVAVPEPGFDLTTSFDGGGSVFADSRRTGMHVPTDVPLVVDHPDVSTAGASPFDVAPTVLDLLDIEPGDAVEGASLRAE